MPTAKLKPLEWVASSKRDVKAFPSEVRDAVGYAIYLAQIGSKHADAKPLKGLGTGTLEVVASWRGNAFRAVYTVRFARAVYILHAFQKKATRGSTTPRPEIELIRARLKAAERHYETNYVKDQPDGS